FTLAPAPSSIRIFPRRIRRGLIEGPSNKAIPGLFSYFRDGFVAASLKDVSFIGGIGIRCSFPRRIRRGLIEAFDREPIRDALLRFRDGFVAASLKRE